MTRTQIVGTCDVRLWGLTSEQRLQRQLASVADLLAGGDDRVLLVRADYLFEVRTLRGLLGRDGVLRDGVVAAAAHVRGVDVDAAMAALDGRDHALPEFDVRDLEAFEGHLRKAEPPLLEHVSADRRALLESRLYGVAYKGITDFVTKWWWPRPARVGVRLCAELGITPNAVTITGVVLMLLACVLFATGHYAAGLAAGWVMTWLDTVDGKLARVTVQSSRIGHILDHGMDILHPPFWYWCWGASLALPLPGDLPVSAVVIAIFAGYVGGRLIEAAFHTLGSVSMFAWRPFDAYFRLFTARRNPCLVLMTGAWALGAPEWSFLLVAAWTLLTTGVMAVRLAQAAVVRMRHGPLGSWLGEPDVQQRYPRAFQTFASTRRAYE